MKVLTSFLCRLFFVGAFILLASAVSEKLIGLFGVSVFNYNPGKLLGFSVVSLLFVITLELRNIRTTLENNNGERELVSDFKHRRIASSLLAFYTIILLIFVFLVF